MKKQLKFLLFFGIFFFGFLALLSLVLFFIDEEETSWLWIFLALFFIGFFSLALFTYLKFEMAEIQEDKIVILDRHRNKKKVFDTSEIEKYGLTIQPNNNKLILFINGKKVKINSLGNKQFDSVWEYLIANKVQRVGIKNYFVASIIYCIVILLIFGGISFMWRQQCIDGINDAVNNIEVSGIIETIQDQTKPKHKAISIKLVSDTTEYKFTTFYYYLTDREFLSNVNQGDSLFLKIPSTSQYDKYIYPVAISDKKQTYLSLDEYEEYYSSQLKYSNWGWIVGVIFSLLTFLGQSYQWKRQDKLSKEKEEKYWRDRGSKIKL